MPVEKCAPTPRITARCALYSMDTTLKIALSNYFFFRIRRQKQFANHGAAVDPTSAVHSVAERVRVFETVKLAKRT